MPFNVRHPGTQHPGCRAAIVAQMDPSTKAAQPPAAAHCARWAAAAAAENFLPLLAVSLPLRLDRLREKDDSSSFLGMRYSDFRYLDAPCSALHRSSDQSASLFRTSGDGRKAHTMGTARGRRTVCMNTSAPQQRHTWRKIGNTARA